MPSLRSILWLLAVLSAPAELSGGGGDGLANLQITGCDEKPNPLEAQLLSDTQDGRLDEHSLLRAALIAEGVADPLELDGHHRKLSQWTDCLNERHSQSVESPSVDASLRRARAALEFLHQEILTGGYQADCSQVSAALSEGRFNCVSATLLFNCLAQELGLEAVAVESPGHVASRLSLAQNSIDVETTCPDWFDHDDKSTRPRQVPGRDNASPWDREDESLDPRVLSDIQFLAIVYYNRGVERLAAQQFREAITVLRRAFLLDPDSPSIRGNLLAAVNNWALDLSKRRRYEEAVGVLAQGRAAAPDHHSFDVNYVAVHQAWLDSLYEAEDYETAVEVIQRAATAMPDERFFDVARLVAYRRWGRSLILDDRLDDALALFAQLRQRQPIALEARSAEAAAFNDVALEKLRTRDYPAALRVLGQGCRRQPDSLLLASNYRAAVMHWADEAFRRSDYSEAVRRTHFALVKLPRDEALRGNVRYGYHHWLEQLAAAGRQAAAREVLEQARREDPQSSFWNSWGAKLWAN